jgi:hypothetical protein
MVTGTSRPDLTRVFAGMGAGQVGRTPSDCDHLRGDDHRDQASGRLSFAPIPSSHPGLEAHVRWLQFERDRARVRRLFESIDATLADFDSSPAGVRASALRDFDAVVRDACR